MLDLSQFNSSSIPGCFPICSAVYIVCRDDFVRYVGQTSNLQRRMKEHKDKYAGSVVYWFQVPQCLLLAIEGILIRRAQPGDNIRRPVLIDSCAATLELTEVADYLGKRLNDFTADIVRDYHRSQNFEDLLSRARGEEPVDND